MVDYTAPQGLMSVPEIASTAEDVVKSVMRVEPMIAGMAGMFVPGLSMVQPWIILIAPYLEQALDDLSKGNNGDALAGLLQLIQHISKNGANSPILSPAMPTPSLANSLGSSSIGGSAQGSG